MGAEEGKEQEALKCVNTARPGYSNRLQVLCPLVEVPIVGRRKEGKEGRELVKGANSQKPNDFVTASHSWPEFLRIIRLGFNACRLIRGHKIGQICEWNGKRCDTSFISLSWDFILLDFKIELNNNNTFLFFFVCRGDTILHLLILRSNKRCLVVLQGITPSTAQAGDTRVPERQPASWWWHYKVTDIFGVGGGWRKRRMDGIE